MRLSETHLNRQEHIYWISEPSTGSLQSVRSFFSALVFSHGLFFPVYNKFKLHFGSNSFEKLIFLTLQLFDKNMGPLDRNQLWPVLKGQRSKLFLKEAYNNQPAVWAKCVILTRAHENCCPYLTSHPPITQCWSKHPFTPVTSPLAQAVTCMEAPMAHFNVMPSGFSGPLMTLNDSLNGFISYQTSHNWRWRCYTLRGM